MPLHCPECGDPLARSGVCGSCGYGRNKTQARIVDPDWHRCANVDRGMRCAKPGSVSHGTHGGGPWYCPTHAFPHDAPAERIGDPLRAIRGFLRKPDPYEALERAAIQSEDATNAR